VPAAAARGGGSIGLVDHSYNYPRRLGSLQGDIVESPLRAAIDLECTHFAASRLCAGGAPPPSGEMP
jgi:hypothetical protein